MQFKKTYLVVETGYQRNIYYYVDSKRVSGEVFYWAEHRCQLKGMHYNSSLLITRLNGRTCSSYCYN